MRYTPDQVRLILVDPKRVELGAYNDLPHLLTEVVTNPKKAANALDWAVREMDMRYELLAEVGVRDITGYNAACSTAASCPPRTSPTRPPGKGYERLPFIVIVVDELNDLMMVAARDVEASICRIAQMARAVGIHLIIATQRPSVDVITGVIKANVPSRHGVLGEQPRRLARHPRPGRRREAHRPGRHAPARAGSGRAQRIQGSWVDEECVRKVVAHWRRQVDARPPTSRASPTTTSPGCWVGRRRLDDDDRRAARRGHGARGAQRARLHEHVAAQAAGRVRPGRAAHGPARAPGRRRPVGGFEGPARSS